MNHIALESTVSFFAFWTAVFAFLITDTAELHRIQRISPCFHTLIIAFFPELIIDLLLNHYFLQVEVLFDIKVVSGLFRLDLLNLLGSAQCLLFIVSIVFLDNGTRVIIHH